MFPRFRRSWRIAVMCLRLLNEDRSLMLFPLFSSIATIVLLVSFGIPIWIGIHAGAAGERMLGLHSSGHLVVYAALYLVCYSVTTFFNTGLIFVAFKRMEGQPATVGDGLRAAASRLDKILGYCVIAATVGMVLRAVEERVGFIGRLFTGFFGFAFTIATALAVPALVAGDVGPIDAIKQSIGLMKRTWGENIIGNAGVSALTSFSILAVIISTVVLVGLAAEADMTALALVIGAAGFIAFCLVILISATLHSIYTAALFRYASGASIGAYFDPLVLGTAYRVRS